MQYFLETFAQDRGDRNESNAFEMRIGIRTTLLVFRFYRNDDENTVKFLLVACGTSSKHILILKFPKLKSRQLKVLE